ncbi:putative reverse transcriptase domain-containing protein, partial [Tanacetum coccineum]
IIMANVNHDDEVPVVEPNQHNDVPVVPEPVLEDEDEDPNFGSDNEDSNEHIEKVLEIVDLLHIPNKKWHNGTSTRCRSTETSDGLAVIQAQLNNLGREIKKEDNIEATTLGFYKGIMETLRNQERKTKIPQLEESLSKFMAKFAKRHKEWKTPTLIQEFELPRILADLGASISVMPFSNYTNLGLGELGPTKLIVELADRTVKRPKGIAENVLVGIDKFVFPVDFFVLDMREDIKTPLILGKPFFDKPASNIIKRVYALSLTERMELDLEVRLMGEALMLNRSLDPLYGDYIELNDLNEPLKLRRNQVDDLKPTIEEGEVIDEPMMDIVKTRCDSEIIDGLDEYPRSEYIKNEKVEEWLTRGHVSAHEME